MTLYRNDRRGYDETDAPVRRTRDEDGNRQLGFKAGAAPYIEERLLTTTVRLLFPSAPEVQPGDYMSIVCRGVGQVRVQVTGYARKFVRDLADEDLEGCTPDCATVDALVCSLGNFFNRAIREDDAVEIIDFEYLD